MKRGMLVNGSPRAPLQPWSGPCLRPSLGSLKVAIAEGDTITVLDRDKHQHKIRFNGIDAPEKKQPFRPTLQAELGLADLRSQRPRRMPQA
jgi:hypothetical protein